MPTDLDTLRDELTRRLPVRSGRFQIQLATAVQDSVVWVDDRGGLFVSLLLVLYNDDVIDDCKEQSVYLGTFAAHPIARWLGYIEGTARSLSAIVDELQQDPRSLLPVDLFGYWKLRHDPQLQTSDEFAAALSDRSRLAELNRLRSEGEWREVLAPCGLAEQSLEVRALLRSSVRLSLERDEPSEGELHDDLELADSVPHTVGASRIGGADHGERRRSRAPYH